MVLLKNGLVVNPEKGSCQIENLLVDKEGKLHIYGKDEKIPQYEDMIIYNCEGLIIGPGLVDAHVHFRDPGYIYKEDLISGGESAARGGVTHVILMANTNPMVDNAETLEYVLKKGKKAKTNIYSCCTISRKMQGKEYVDFELLKKAGAVAFTDDGIPLKDAEFVETVMKEAVKNDIILSFHEENPDYIENNGINKGKASEYYGIGGSSREAEITMVKRDIELALKTGARINIQHISCRETVELIKEAKMKAMKMGLNNICAEVTPHHLALTEEAVIKYGTCAKMNPPLRTEEDRQALIRGVMEGIIDCIVTDHAPHSVEEKKKPITDAPSGIIGLETSLAVSYNILCRDNHMPVLDLFCRNSYLPGKIYGIDAGKLAIDKTANVVIFDPNMIQNRSSYCSKSQNSPFLSEKIIGDVVGTICNGKFVYENMKDKIISS